MRYFHSLFISTLFLLPGFHLSAQESIPSHHRLTEMELHQLNTVASTSFLEDVEETKIYSGKKTLSLHPDSTPLDPQQNWRKILAHLPGITLEEESSQQIRLNTGFHGLPTVNSMFSQILVDGFPINFDIPGIWNAYYLPDLQGVREIQVVSSGQGVLFGPQHGGAINFVTYSPAADQPFRFKATQTVGSDGAFSSFLQAEGVVNGTGYVVFGKRLEGDGYRDRQQFSVDYSGFRLFLGLGSPTRWTLGFMGYSDRVEIPGGLTQNQVDGNREQAVLGGDFQTIQRYMPTLLLEHEFHDATRLEWRSWLTHVDRFSDTTINRDHQEQQFFTGGTETRVRHHYDLGESSGHDLTGGFMLQFTESPILDIRTTTGITRTDLDRQVDYASLFVENRFQITDAWSVIPGARLDRYRQGASGPTTGGVAGFINRDHEDIEPLWSLGSEWDVLEGSSFHDRPLILYGNISTGYRPASFAEGIQNNFTFSPSSNLSASHSTQETLGIRGTPTPWHSFDLSGFFMKVEDQVGTSVNSIGNFGTTEHSGMDLFQQTDLLSLFDWILGKPSTRPPPMVSSGKVLHDREGAGKWGRLDFFSSLSLLQVEITDSPVAGDVGRSPQYAPAFTARFGLEYNYFERVKTSLQAHYVGESLGSATSSDFAAGTEPIPAHTVWDWGMEAFIMQDSVSIFAGINNLFDSDYYSRSRGGIDPAPGRNFYGGLKVTY